MTGTSMYDGASVASSRRGSGGWQCRRSHGGPGV